MPQKFGLHYYFLYLCSAFKEECIASKGCGSANQASLFALALHLTCTANQEKRRART